MEVKSQLSMIVAATTGAFGLAILTLLITNPTQIGPFGVTLWFLILMFGVSGAFTLALYYAKARLKLYEGPLTQLSNSRRQGLLLGLGVVVLLALSSLRQLNLRDVILVSVLLVLLEFYFRTRA